MRQYIIIFAICGAFVFEWILSAAVAGTVVFVPVAALVFLVLSWRMEFRARMWCALAVGFLMDTVQMIPFGASLLACVLSAVLCEIFRVFFSNTESHITQGVGTVLLMLVFFITVPLFGFLLGTFI